MNKLMTRYVLLLAMLCNLGTLAWAEPSVEGKWRTIDDATGKPRSIVELKITNGVLEGVITQVFLRPGEAENPICDKCDDERHNQPVIGMKFLWGLKADDDEYTGGKVLDPDNGKIYRCYVKLIEGGKKIKIRGYIGISLLGRSQEWERVE